MSNIKSKATTRKVTLKTNLSLETGQPEGMLQAATLDKQ